jgi:hypothetical protein
VHLDPHEDAVQQLGVRGPDLDQRRRLVAVLAAQLEALDPVVAAVLQDVVQDPGQDAGVHQVAGDRDRGGVRQDARGGAHARTVSG